MKHEQKNHKQSMKRLKFFSLRSHHNARILEYAKAGDEASLGRVLHEEHKKKPLSRTLQQALSHAIDARNAACVRLLVEAGANPNCIKSTQTPIPIPVYVIKEGLYDILQALLDHGCNVNMKWLNNETALHVAVRLRREEATRRLMSAGADPTIANDRRETPLTLAAQDDALTLLDILLQHPDASASVDDMGRTLLHTAVRGGQPLAVRRLMERGFTPDVTADQPPGYSPLMDAVTRGLTDVVRVLTVKCDIDYVGWHGMTALLMSAQGNSPTCLKVLIDAGADVNMQDDMGSSALIHAGPFEKVINLLLQYGADCNLQNHFGMTALWFAAFYQYTHVVTLLLRANSDPELKGMVEDEFHTSPLEISLKRGHYDISRRIIYSGCNNRNLARFMVNADIMPVFRNCEAGRNLRTWIRDWLREVKSLRYLSRLRIRQSIGRIKTLEKVKRLPLPQLLIQFVNLSEVDSI